MTRLKTFLGLLLLSITVAANAQISRTNADYLVLNTIVNDSTKAVYCLDDGVGSGALILTADGQELKNPYDSAYVYFVDDIPAANWAHSCRYCFVNVANGTYTIENQRFYPVNHDSFMRIGATSNGSRLIWPFTNYIIPQKAASNSKLYAVLIGGDPGTQAPIKTWYNLSCVYTALVNKYGYKEKQNYADRGNLFVIAPSEVENAVKASCEQNGYYSHDLNHNNNDEYENDFIDSITFPYSKNSIQRLFCDLTTQQYPEDNMPVLTEDDQLFVFLCGHGSGQNGNSWFVLNKNNDNIYDYELANYVRNIRCSQITFLIDCCYSGGFIDDLLNDTEALCKNRVVYTATDSNHSSYVEWHITRDNRGLDNPWQRVDEFVYYWFASLTGYYPILETHDNWLAGPWYQYDSTAIGHFPWGLIPSFEEGSGYSHIGYDINPDSNNDSIVTMDEAFVFTNNLDSYSLVGYYHPAENNTSYTEYPCSSYESTFTKELITLDGYKGTIDDTVETGLNRKYYLDGNVNIENDAVATINDGCQIIGRNNNLSIVNRGSLFTANNVSDVMVKNISLEGHECDSFAFSNCIFDTCGIIAAYNSPLSITNSTLRETRITSANDSQSGDTYYTNIIGNVINNTSGNTIYFDRLPQCSVRNNIINSGYNGIYVNQLAEPSQNYDFRENMIRYCSDVGFVAYSSNAIVCNNDIMYNAGGGLKSLNLSNLYVSGYQLSSDMYDGQRIVGNGFYQVFASLNSYPANFHYNILIGAGRTNDTILLFESPTNTHRITQFHVDNNCWEPLTNGEIPAHLYTGIGGQFIYLPVWDPLITPDPQNPPADRLAAGNDLIQDGEYNEARDIMMDIVSDYPGSPEAMTALKTLFSIEIASDGDFSDLKDYYLNLVSNDYLGNLADNLANRCDVKMGNYTDAIEWYENKIISTNSTSSERIFAEIDLGNLYLRMRDNADRSIGRMPEYVPKSKADHTKRTEYLLSLLPGDMDDNMAISYDGFNLSDKLVVCYPNPINNTAVVTYSLESEAEVAISIVNLLGEEVKRVYIGRQSVGNHDSVFDFSNIPNGTYFCEVIMNNCEKKMTKIVIQR